MRRGPAMIARGGLQAPAAENNPRRAPGPGAPRSNVPSAKPVDISARAKAHGERKGRCPMKAAKKGSGCPKRAEKRRKKAPPGSASESARRCRPKNIYRTGRIAFPPRRSPSTAKDEPSAQFRARRQRGAARSAGAINRPFSAISVRPSCRLLSAGPRAPSAKNEAKPQGAGPSAQASSTIPAGGRQRCANARRTIDRPKVKRPARSGPISNGNCRGGTRFADQSPQRRKRQQRDQHGQSGPFSRG